MGRMHGHDRMQVIVLSLEGLLLRVTSDDNDGVEYSQTPTSDLALRPSS